jgi:hypothetical protein
MQHPRQTDQVKSSYFGFLWLFQPWNNATI